MMRSCGKFTSPAVRESCARASQAGQAARYPCARVLRSHFLIVNSSRLLTGKNLRAHKHIQRCARRAIRGAFDP